MSPLFYLRYAITFVILSILPHPLILSVIIFIFSSVDPVGPFGRGFAWLWSHFGNIVVSGKKLLP